MRLVMSFPFRLVLAAIGLALVFVMASPARPSAAVGTYDFGSHPVGTTTTASVTVPLQGSLSDLPSDTVIYNGGNPTIDFYLAVSGVSTPVTVGSFISAFGDLTFTYQITGAALQIGYYFSADASACIGAVASCAVSVSFTPLDVGVLTDAASPLIENAVLSNSTLPIEVLNAFSPILVDLMGGVLAVTLTGEGTAVPEGGVTLLVSAVGPAPCIILSDSTLEFGTVRFSSPVIPSSASQPVAWRNCGPDDESVYARGTDATGNQIPLAVWSLVDSATNPCDLGIDLYGLMADRGVGAPLHVTTSNQFLSGLFGFSNDSAEVVYQMPCQGSAGAGQLMTSQLTFMATVP